MADRRNVRREPESGTGEAGGLTSFVRRAASVFRRARNRISLRLGPRGLAQRAERISRSTEGTSKMLRTSRRIAEWSGAVRLHLLRPARGRLAPAVRPEIGRRNQLSTAVLERYRLETLSSPRQPLPLAPRWLKGLTRSLLAPVTTDDVAVSGSRVPARRTVRPAGSTSGLEMARRVLSRSSPVSADVSMQGAGPASRRDDILIGAPEDGPAPRPLTEDVRGHTEWAETPQSPRHESVTASPRAFEFRQAEEDTTLPAYIERGSEEPPRRVYRAVWVDSEPLPTGGEKGLLVSSNATPDQGEGARDLATWEVEGQAEQAEGVEREGQDARHQVGRTAAPTEAGRRRAAPTKERGTSSEEAPVAPLQTPTAARGRHLQKSEGFTGGIPSVRRQMVRPREGAAMPWRWPKSVLQRVRSAVLRPPPRIGGRAGDARHSGHSGVGRSGALPGEGSVGAREAADGLPEIVNPLPEGRGWLPSSQSSRGAPVRRQREGGRALRPAQRTAMEQLLDDDFGDVRVHTDVEASRAAAELRADAFTEGQDIYFATGRAGLQSPEGTALLGHELTHVRQARRGGGEPDHGSMLRGIAEEREALANEMALRRHLESSELSRPTAPGPAMDLPNLRIQLDGLAASGRATETAVRGATLPGATPPVAARAPADRAAEQAPTADGVSPAPAREAETGGGGKDLDVDAVASQVYEMILRRLTLERERMGFH